jgi:hypothetical protein
MSNQPSNKRLQLLTNATANSTGEWLEWSGVGVGTLAIYGTFDTCSVTVQISTNGGVTAIPYASAYTSAAHAQFEEGNILVRAVLSSVGGSTSVSCDLVGAERP